jgi:hypothetical protein
MAITRGKQLFGTNFINSDRRLALRIYQDGKKTILFHTFQYFCTFEIQKYVFSPWGFMFFFVLLLCFILK